MSWDALLPQSEPDMDALAHIPGRVQAASTSACGRDARHPEQFGGCCTLARTQLRVRYAAQQLIRMSHSPTARVASAENEDWAEFGRPGSERLVVDMELGNLTVLRVNSPKDRGHAPLPHLSHGAMRQCRASHPIFRLVWSTSPEWPAADIRPRKSR